MAPHQLWFPPETAKQSSLFFVCFFRAHRLLACFYTAGGTHISQLCCHYRPPVYQKRMSSLRSSEGICPARLTESSFGPTLHSLIPSSVSVNLTEDVMLSAQAPYNAAGFLSCQAIWGFLFVLLAVFEMPSFG